MEHEEFKVRVKTIVYTALKCGERDIYGIPDVFVGKTPMDFPVIEAEAMEELVQNGYAQMDFDGKIQIDSNFMDLVKSCARSREVAGIDIRREDGIQRHMTVYFIGDVYDSNIITLKNLSGDYMGVCILQASEEVQILEWIKETILQEKKNTVVKKRIALESGVFRRCEKKELIKNGCSEEESDLIAGAVNGKRTVIIVRKIRGDSGVGTCSFVCGPEGELEMIMDYSNNMERVVFEPVDAQLIRQKVHQVLTS